MKYYHQLFLVFEILDNLNFLKIQMIYQCFFKLFIHFLRFIYLCSLLVDWMVCNCQTIMCLKIYFQFIHFILKHFIQFFFLNLKISYFCFHLSYFHFCFRHIIDLNHVIDYLANLASAIILNNSAKKT